MPQAVDAKHVSQEIASSANPFIHLHDLNAHMANAKKVALITGANKGLGLEMARQLGRAGVTVVLAARDPQKGEAAAEALRREGIDAQFLKLDVTNRQDHAAAAKFVEQNFGRLDILINNAGVSIEQLGSGRPSITTDDVIQ